MRSVFGLKLCMISEVRQKLGSTCTLPNAGRKDSIRNSGSFINVSHFCLGRMMG